MTRLFVSALLLAATLAGACANEPALPTAPTAQVAGTPASGATGGAGVQSGCVPSAPTNLRVTSMAGTLVELSWDTVAGATSYTLLVGSTPGATDILSSNTTQTSFRFTARDGRQFARVQAHTACAPGPATGSIEFTVRP